MITYIVHYAELGLKGKNRPMFEQRLARNIRVALRDLGACQVQRFYSYLRVDCEQDDLAPVIEERLARVFGIAYFAPVTVTAQDPAAIAEAVERLALQHITPNTSFRIDTRRGDKKFPITSVELDRELGARVVALTGATVKLRDADVCIVIQIYIEGAFIFCERRSGAGGLPVGVSGRVLTLVSGGFDSPVAAHLMLKRGCMPDFLHFHMLPTTEQVRNSKVVALVRQLLEPHRITVPLYLAPAHPFQMAMLERDSRLEVVLFRRFVMRVGEALAHQRGAQALVTGDSLGQVASQTLTNLAVISQATTLPILRPLIGFDKLEITNLAQHIGTHDLSAAPYQDPCSMHAHNPKTYARLAEVEAIEAELDMDALIAETLAQMEEIWFTW